MTPERARQLLGGLSTGILTAEERQSLFEAALSDQNLFNEVADELEFAAFLQSPETRAQLASRISIDEDAIASAVTPRRWWWLRPAWLALAGALAASVVLFVVIGPHWESSMRRAAVNAPAPAVQERTAEDAKEAAPPPPKVSPKSGQPGPIETDARKLYAKTGEPPQAEVRRQRPAPPPQPQAETQGPKLAAAPPAPAPKEEAKSAMGNLGGVGGMVPVQPRFEGQTQPNNGFSMAPRAATPATSPKDAASAPSPRAATAPPIAEPDSAAAPYFRATPTPPGTGAPAPVAAPAEKPSFTAALTGSVHDTAGGAIRNARVAITNTETNTTASAVTDAAGRFVIPSLTPGTHYTVSAEAPGFQKELRAGVTVSPNRVTDIDLPLNVGLVAETVEITAATSSIAEKSRQKAQLKTLNIANTGNLQQIAIVDFLNATPESQAGQRAADLVALQLSQQLDDNSQVRVMDRGRVQQAWQTQARAQSQINNGKQPSVKEITAFGRDIGADAVIVGKVQNGPVNGRVDGVQAKTGTGGDVAVTAQVIETKKARGGSTVTANGTLQGATNQLGSALASQLAPPVEGAIERIDQNAISIQFHGSAGPKIGARFSVYHGSRKIGDVTLSAVYGQYAVGTYSGGGQPRIGDRVTSAR